MLLHSASTVGSCGFSSFFFLCFLVGSVNQLANCSMLLSDCSGGFFATYFTVLTLAVAQPHSAIGKKMQGLLLVRHPPFHDNSALYHIRSCVFFGSCIDVT